MHDQLAGLLGATALILALPAWSAPAERGGPVAIKTVGALPLFFEPNAGQFRRHVAFLSRTGGSAVLLTGTGVSIEPPAGKSASRLSLRWHGAEFHTPLAGEERLAATANYFAGSDPRRWRTSVPLYGKVRYVSVYPGISMVFHGTGRDIEQDWIVAPGGKPERITIDVEGASRIAMGESGEVVLESAVGSLSLRKPFAYQNTAQGRHAVEASFVLLGRQRIGFRLGAYDRKLDLIIDPVLNYSTYFGSGSAATAVAQDSAGNIYVAGTTPVSGMTTTSAAQGAYGGGDADGFVLKVSSDGRRLIYATYLGGTGADTVRDIAADSAGNAYIAGQTSGGFPLAHPIQASENGSSDAFVAKLGPQGNALIYSTYLGGSGSDFATGIAVDAQGSAYIGGWTSSTDFPTVHPIQANLTEGQSGFVAKLNPAGTALVYATYLGEVVNGIAVDAAGSAYVTGLAGAQVPGLGGVPCNSNHCCYASKLAADGSSLAYSTYVGATGSSACLGIAVDPSGSAYVAGQTYLDGNGFADTFVAKLSASGSQMAYLTYLGGSGDDFPSRVAVDSSGSAYVVGSTGSGDFPVLAPFQSRTSSASVFVSPDGGVTWSGVSQPNVDSRVSSITVDPRNPGTLYVSGYKSTDGGLHWSAMSRSGILAVDPQTTTTLYSCSDGVYKSIDGGANWSKIVDLAATCTSMAIDPTDPRNIYVGTGGAVSRSSDGGATWSQSSEGLGFGDIWPLVIDPLNPTHLYAGTQLGLYRSTDSGATWQLSNPTANMGITALAADPATSGIVYAGMSGAVVKSTDGGATWTQLDTIPIALPEFVTAIVIDPTHPATLFFSASGITGGVYKSGDAGATWKPTGPGMAAYGINALALSGTNPPTLYAGGQGAFDAFVTKLTPSGALAYSTYLGGSGQDMAMAITAGRGVAIVVGGTASPDFPSKTPRSSY